MVEEIINQILFVTALILVGMVFGLGVFFFIKGLWIMLISGPAEAIKTEDYSWKIQALKDSASSGAWKFVGGVFLMFISAAAGNLIFTVIG